jgi:hypothetical protein
MKKKKKKRGTHDCSLLQHATWLDHAQLPRLKATQRVTAASPHKDEVVLHSCTAAAARCLRHLAAEQHAVHASKLRVEVAPPRQYLLLLLLQAATLTT